MKKLLICGFLAAGIFCNAQEAKTDTAPEIVASDTLLLHVGFDNTCNALAAKGNSKPASIHGKPQYQPRVNGQALLGGKEGGYALYWCKGNLNFDKPGSITLWFKAAGEWHRKPGRGIVLWGLGNNKGYIGFRISSMPTDVCPCRRPLQLTLYFSKMRRNAEYSLPPPALTKICRNWHMASFAWDGDQLFMSYDGAPYKAFKLEKPFSNAEFEHSTRFGVNQHASDMLMDDLRIYGKKLTDEELNKIWNIGQRQIFTGNAAK